MYTNVSEIACDIYELIKIKFYKHGQNNRKGSIQKVQEIIYEVTGAMCKG